MKTEISNYGRTTTRAMSQQDADKWMNDFKIHGQAFSKEVNGIDIYLSQVNKIKEGV